MKILTYKQIKESYENLPFEKGKEIFYLNNL